MSMHSEKKILNDKIVNVYILASPTVKTAKILPTIDFDRII